MTTIKKHLLMFVVYSLVFIGILYLIDWFSDQLNVWYSYALQGFFFGLFMTLYNYWTDTKKKKEDNKNNHDE